MQKVMRGKCGKCGKVVKAVGIGGHMRSHGIKAQKGENWEPMRAAPTKAGNLKKPKSRRIITPDSKFVDIPMVFRIPLTIGPIQIVSIE